MSTTTQTENDVYAKVKEVICRELSVSESKVTETATFAGDLQADSLCEVELVMALEDEFDVSITDDEAESLRSVGEVVRFLIEKGA